MARSPIRSAYLADYLTEGEDFSYTGEILGRNFDQPVGSISQMDAAKTPLEDDAYRGLRSTASRLTAGDLYREADFAQRDGDLDSADRLREQARAAEQTAADFAPRVSSHEQVQNIGDAIDFAQSGFGQLAPTMAAPMAGGLTGAGVGAAIGSLAGPVGTAVGGYLGGALGAAYPAFQMEAGEQASSQAADPFIMENTTAEERLREQNIKGGQNALLESLFPALFGGRVIGGSVRRLAGEALKRSPLRRTAAFARETGVEAATEGAQTLTGQASLSRLNPNRDTSGDVTELIDSIILGALGGGGISLGTTVPGYLLEKGGQALERQGEQGAAQLGEAAAGLEVAVGNLIRRENGIEVPVGPKLSQEGGLQFPREALEEADRIVWDKLVDDYQRAWAADNPSLMEEVAGKAKEFLARRHPGYRPVVESLMGRISEGVEAVDGSDTIQLNATDKKPDYSQGIDELDTRPIPLFPASAESVATLTRQHVRNDESSIKRQLNAWRREGFISKDFDLEAADVKPLGDWLQEQNASREEVQAEVDSMFRDLERRLDKAKPQQQQALIDEMVELGNAEKDGDFYKALNKYAVLRFPESAISGRFTPEDAARQQRSSFLIDSYKELPNGRRVKRTKSEMKAAREELNREQGIQVKLSTSKKVPRQIYKDSVVEHAQDFFRDELKSFRDGTQREEAALLMGVFADPRVEALVLTDENGKPLKDKKGELLTLTQDEVNLEDPRHRAALKLDRPQRNFTPVREDPTFSGAPGDRVSVDSDVRSQEGRLVTIGSRLKEVSDEIKVIRNRLTSANKKKEVMSPEYIEDLQRRMEGLQKVREALKQRAKEGKQGAFTPLSRVVTHDPDADITTFEAAQGEDTGIQEDPIVQLEAQRRRAEERVVAAEQELRAATDSTERFVAEKRLERARKDVTRLTGELARYYDEATGKGLIDKTPIPVTEENPVIEGANPNARPNRGNVAPRRPRRPVSRETPQNTDAVRESSGTQPQPTPEDSRTRAEIDRQRGLQIMQEAQDEQDRQRGLQIMQEAQDEQEAWRQGLPEHTIDRNLKNKDGSKKLAGTNMETGEIRINPVETLKEFFDYFEGKTNSPTSQQKKIVLNQLAAAGTWTRERIRELVSSPGLANRFLVLHEADHVAHLENDREVYRRNPRLTSPGKIRVERRATEAALNQLQREVDSVAEIASLKKIDIKTQRGTSIEADEGVKQDSHSYMKERIKQAIGTKLYETITFSEPRTIGNSKNTKGLFNSYSGDIFVDLTKHRTAEGAVNTAWHELFHSGVHERFIKSENRKNAEEYKTLMAEARDNETISTLMQHVYRDRGWDFGLFRPELVDIATEEAIVELAAAIKTNSTRELELRYGVRIPKSFIKSRETRGLLQRFVDFIGRLIYGNRFGNKKLTKLSKEASDAKILEIIRESGDAIAANRRWYTENKATTLNKEQLRVKFRTDHSKRFSTDIGKRLDQIIETTKHLFWDHGTERGVSFKPEADWVAVYRPYLKGKNGMIRLNAAHIQTEAQALWAIREVTQGGSDVKFSRESRDQLANDLILGNMAKSLREKGWRLVQDENGEYMVLDQEGNRVENEETKKTLSDIPRDMRFRTMEEAMADPEVRRDKAAVKRWLVRAFGPEILHPDNLGWMLVSDPPTFSPGFYAGDRFVDRAGNVYEDYIGIAVDSLNPLSTAFHEGLHKFVKQLRDNGNRDLYDRLVKAATAPHVQKQLEKLMAEYPAAIEQMRNDPEEAVAYAFQYYALSREGDVKFRIQPSLKQLFAKIAESLKRMVGIMTHAKASEEIFAALYEGRVHRDGMEALQKYRERTFRQYADDIMPALKSSVPKLLSSPITQLQRLRNGQNMPIPAFTTLAKALHSEPLKGGGAGLIYRQYQTTAQYGNRWRAILQEHNVTEEELRDSLRHFQSMQPPRNRFEEDIRHFLDRLYAYQFEGPESSNPVRRLEVIDEENGQREWVKPTKVDNYWSRIWSPENIRDNEIEFREVMREEGNLTDDVIDNFIEMLEATGGTEVGSELQRYRADFSPYNKAINARAFTFINEENAHRFAKFQEQDFAKTMDRYIRQAVHRREHSRVFKHDGSGIAEIFEAARAQGATQEQIDYAEKVVKGVEGRLGTDNVSDAARDAMVASMSVTNFAVLGMALFSSMVDPLGIMVRTGSVKNAAKAYKSGFAQILHDARKTKSADQEITEYLGVIEEDMVQDMLNNMERGIYMNEKMRKLNKFFFKSIGLEQWTRGTRIAATRASMEYLKQYADDAQRLAEVGLEVGDIEIFENRIKLKPGEFDPNLSDASIEKARRVQNAVFRMVDESVLRPSAATRPLWMSDMRFRLLGHLKSYTFTFHNQIINQIFTRAKNAENIVDAATAFMPLLTYVPVMLAADMMRGMIQGDDEDRDWDEIVGRAIQRSAILGTGTFFMDIKDEMDWGNVPTNTLLGPTISTGLDISDAAVDADRSFIDATAKLMPYNVLWRDWGDE